MIEFERTYLAKYLPDNLEYSPSKKIIDLYIENGTPHSFLRVRKNGDSHCITRKTPVVEGDASTHFEETIPIDVREFESLRQAKSRIVEKTRYRYSYGALVAELDVFEGALQGLVLVDFEFSSETEMNTLLIPDFCLHDVTQETFIAGGVLAGKSLRDIDHELARFHYKPLSFVQG